MSVPTQRKTRRRQHTTPATSGKRIWTVLKKSVERWTARSRNRIRASLTPIAGHSSSCGCFSLADTLIRFPDPDQSLKRPDIAIFCEHPPESDEALESLPAAVIEILSLGYEDKDIGDDGAPFYLACGIADVLVVDPRSRVVLHYQPGAPKPKILQAPITVDLTCGCRCTI